MPAGENQNKKRNRVYYFLYVMLSLADMLRGLNALLHALVLGPYESLCFLNSLLLIPFMRNSFS